MRLQLGPAKGKDFATAVGPWITTVDELDLADLDMRARVNGEEWSLGTSGSIWWSPGELLAYISWGETLQPGDLVGSGTTGLGCGLELGRRLEPGDVVEPLPEIADSLVVDVDAGRDRTEVVLFVVIADGATFGPELIEP